MYKSTIGINLEKEFSLVLSGGGALGIAHINVLRLLDEHQLKPKEILGVSMGAIIGAAYALNHDHKAIYQFIEQFSNIFKWGKLSFSNGSLLSTSKIRELLLQIYQEKKMSEVEIPLTLVATDFSTGKAKLFKNDNDTLIVDAILASMAIPGIFPPVKINEQYLVDGFIASNLPVEYAQYKTILASNVLGKNSFNDFQEKDYSFFGHTKAMLEMLERSVRLIMYNKTHEVLKNNDNILLIEPDVANFKTFEFHKYKEIISASQSISLNNLDT
ncbi:MAG: patatin-like phospholipase family protein [Gammaproteobacteria bacterium]|nr:patatin-like phospholipase family protein [Gammaproteobacteria bacterium]